MPALTDAQVKTMANAKIEGSAMAAAAVVVSSTVSNLAQQKGRKQQIASMQLQDRLSQLSEQQKYLLALRLQNATTDNERMALLSDSVSQIDAATVQANKDILSASVKVQKSNTITTYIIIGSSAVAFIAALYFLNKKD